MKALLFIVFIVVLLAVFIHGQGAGGGKNRNSDHQEPIYQDNRNYRRPHTNNQVRPHTNNQVRPHTNNQVRPHTNNQVRPQKSNAVLIVVIIIGALAICCCAVCCIACFFGSRTRRPEQNNTKSTNDSTSPVNEPAQSGATTLVKKPTPPTIKYTRVPIEESPTNNLDIFPSGIWSSQYFQYDEWHGPQQLVLSFDPETFTINGYGSDDIGAFNITGRYSNKTNEIELIKKYQRGTGDGNENLGHSVTIEVTWNPDEQYFGGKWYVDTEMFPGEDEFMLRFEKPLESSMDNTNANP